MDGLKIRFDLAFDGGSYPGPLAEGKGATLGHAWLGPKGLLGRLETGLGLTGRYASDEIRAARLVPLLRSREGFWRASFEKDGLATALRLVRDRDRLAMCGWRGEGVSGRLKELWNAVEAVDPGTPDRLANVTEALAHRDAGVAEVVLHESVELLPLRWRQVFERLEERGTLVVAEPIPSATNGGDLGKARAALEGTNDARFVPEGDGSLQLVRAHGPLQAADDLAAWLAAQPSWEGTLILGGDEVLDRALRDHGLPSIGTGGDRTALEALLPLSVEAGWRAADPADLHALLTIQPSPIPRALAFRLIGALQRWPALDSDDWREALEKGLKALESGFREKVAERVSCMFGRAANRDRLYPAAAVRDRIDCLLAWVATRPDDVDGALGAVRVQGETLLEILRTSEQASFSSSELKRWLHVARQSAPRAAVVRAQAGLTSLRRPEAMVGPVTRTIWWNFDLATAPQPPRLRLCDVEREKLEATGVELPDTGAQAQAIANRWRRPLLLTEHELILVCPTTDRTGTDAHPHPLWDEVSAVTTEGKVAAMVHARPNGVHLPPETDLALRRLPEPTLEWTSPAELPMREYESPSGLEKLLGCPLQWALQYHARLGEGVADAPPAPDSPLYGSLAHKILERVLSEWPLTPAEAKARATTLFHESAPRLAEALFLPRYAAQRAAVRHRIIHAAEAIARLLQKNGTTVEAVEASYERKLGEAKLQGRIDLLTHGPSLVIDWKWGSGSHITRLERGTALQLAAYAYLTANGDLLPKAGYFSISSAELHLESGADIDGANTHGSYAMGDTWDAALAALEARKDELGERIVHAPGADTPLEKTLEDKRTKEGDLMIAPGCTYCSFSSMCGKAFGR